MAGTPEYARALQEAQRYAEQFDRSRLHAAPLSGLAVLTCMDVRIQPEQILGLRPGDAHVMRNAGGLATDDAIRSLVVSQQLLGTREVVVIEHTGCGLLGLADDPLRRQLGERTGRWLDMKFGGFQDLEANLRMQVDRIRSHPWIRPGPVHGLVFDVNTGALREVI
jgi:carbonic anhydrase